jgi:hypothetical protein
MCGRAWKRVGRVVLRSNKPRFSVWDCMIKQLMRGGINRKLSCLGSVFANNVWEGLEMCRLVLLRWNELSLKAWDCAIKRNARGVGFILKIKTKPQK